MKELRKFIYINLIVMSSYAVLYCIFFVFLAYFYKTDISLFPIQFFQDTGPFTNNLYDATGSILNEIIWSPHASFLVNNIVSFSVLFIFLYLLFYSIYFFIRHRKNLSIRKRLLILPIFLVFVALYVFIFSLLPTYTSIYIMLKNATNQIKSELATNENISAIHDPEEIMKYLNKNKVPVNVISGYGQYNVAVRNLTENPEKHSMNYYKLIFISTAARYLAAIEDQNKDVSFKYQLYYYPETHQLVVNDLLKLNDFNKFLTKDLITDLNYSLLTDVMNKKSGLSEYKIVSPTEYVKYFTKKIVDENNKSIESDMATYRSNLDVVNECNKIETENKKLVESQTVDYERNCVTTTIYSNCKELKNKIDENIKISEVASIRCKKEEILAKKYNAEILQKIEVFKKNIEEVNTNGTLEKNKAELSNAVFFPPNTIYLKHDKLIYPMIYNSVHEFLHFTVDKHGRNLPSYIDEAMTDYLTYKSLGYDKYLSVAISGYYTEQQILFSLLEKIPFNEMLDVYISGEEKKFEKTFSKYFPNASYSEFSKIGKNIYETTYEVDGKKRSFNLMSNRGYMYSKDVEMIRVLLDLEKSFSYSVLKNLF